jgi:hypothetical protein
VLFYLSSLSVWYLCQIVKQNILMIETTRGALLSLIAGGLAKFAMRTTYIYPLRYMHTSAPLVLFPLAFYLSFPIRYSEHIMLTDP